VASEPRRRRPRADTREQIVGSAQQLVSLHGYSATSIVAVAEGAEVSVGSVYLHFASKEALFDEVFRRAAGGELQAVRDAAAKERSAAARLQVIVETFARRALHSDRLAWALLVEVSEQAVDAERLAFRESYRDTFATVLRKGIASGEFKLHRKGVDVVAAALVGAIAEAMVGPLAPDSARQKDQDRLVAEIVAIALRIAAATRA
jgi:AcrR family transcriptional regulator